MRTTAPGQSALLFLDVAAVLQREQVDYAVIGAMAAAVHGVVRASLDADAVLSFTTQDAQRLEQAFIAAGFHAELRRGDLDDPIACLLALTDTYGNRVDLLIGLRGLEAATFSRTIEVPFMGQSLRFVSREDFLAMKVAANGPQDIEDARNVIAAAGDSLDLVLLRRLAAQYSRSAAASLENLLAKAG
ncbi:MAG: hypothetical protein ACLQFT_07380 [Steroidobacteraceae bacterium]